MAKEQVRSVITVLLRVAAACRHTERDLHATAPARSDMSINNYILSGALYCREGREMVNSKPVEPFDVIGYWTKRYAEGLNSGRGSYGRLAEFKAEVVNDLVARHGIRSIVELGCGDGNQLSMFEVEHYTGVDVSQRAIELCREKHSSRPGFSFHQIGELPRGVAADAAMSLDVIFHLVDDQVFNDYMRLLFSLGERLVVIYSSNRKDDRREGAHVRHRVFTDWVSRQAEGWTLVERIPNRYPRRLLLRKDRSFCDFFVFARTKSGR